MSEILRSGGSYTLLGRPPGRFQASIVVLSDPVYSVSRSKPEAVVSLPSFFYPSSVLLHYLCSILYLVVVTRLSVMGVMV